MNHLRFFPVTYLLLAPLACDGEPVTDDATIDAILEDVDPQMPAFEGGKADGFDIQALMAFHCPGHDPSAGVPNYDGLEGRYLRAAAPVAGEPLSLRLDVTDDDGASVTGEFERTTSAALQLPVPESGEFIAVPNNPAIGPALAFETDANGEFDDLYWVLGLRQSSFSGNVSSLCLGSADQTAEAPFMMVRIGG